MLTKLTMKRSINTQFMDVSLADLVSKDCLINFFYTDPQLINEEISKRRNEIETDPTARYDIDKEFNGYGNKIIGIIHRDITPNLEIGRMIDVCDFLNLSPVLLDNVTDKFSCKSRSKYYLGRMAFFSGFGKNGGMKIDYRKVIDFNGSEGKMQSGVQTIYGDDLMTFHKKIFNEKYHFLSRAEYDIEGLSKESSPIEIYKFIFRMSIAKGVMLENFAYQDVEREFINDVVYPAFISVWNETGYKPIVIPFEPTEMDDEDFWYYYFSNIKDIIETTYNTKL